MFISLPFKEREHVCIRFLIYNIYLYIYISTNLIIAISKENLEIIVPNNILVTEAGFCQYKINVLTYLWLFVILFTKRNNLEFFVANIDIKCFIN